MAITPVFLPGESCGQRSLARLQVLESQRVGLISFYMERSELRRKDILPYNKLVAEPGSEPGIGPV